MPTPTKHSVTTREAGLPDVVVEWQMDWEEIRGIRDGWLSDSDIWMLADRYATLTTSQQTELTTYRQSLRDLPTSTATGLASDCLFPDKPAWFD